MARTPRHPLEVTVDRLGDHYERHYDQLEGAEREAITLIRFALQEIADGNR
jgi:hypothetical protein